MAHNQTGISITIRAFLPMGKGLDEQYAALTIVKDAHASGDYAALLKAALIDDIKTEQKTRRVDDAPTITEDPVADGIDGDPQQDTDTDYTETPEGEVVWATADAEAEEAASAARSTVPPRRRSAA